MRCTIIAGSPEADIDFISEQVRTAIILFVPIRVMNMQKKQVQSLTL